MPFFGKHPLAGALSCKRNAAGSLLRRLVFGLLLFSAATVSWAADDGGPYSDPPIADHHFLPPHIVENAPLPNVLIILDNSRRMDETLDGELVGSFSTVSRSEIARRALKEILSQYGEQMRIGLMSFRLAEDVAAGMYQIGTQPEMNNFVGAWLSSHSPGGGDLVVEIADPGPGREAELLSRIARVEKYNEPYDMKQVEPKRLPIRNAGPTALNSTLASAKDYLEGAVDRYRTEVRYFSPMSARCQKNFIVLLTAGLPSENPAGDGDTITPVVEAVDSLRRTEVVVDGATHSFDVQTFVLGLFLPGGAGGVLDPVAVAGGTDENGRAYYAGGEDQLAATLQRLFKKIRGRAISRSATPVIPASQTGEGAVYQAAFQPVMSDGVQEVHWAGDIRGLFVDGYGHIHESAPDGAGTQKFEEPVSTPAQGGDPFVTMCRDDAQKIVRIHKAYARCDIPSPEQVRDCDPTLFVETIENLEWLWSGGEWLAEMTDAVYQRAYHRAESKRYIFTGIDNLGGDGQISAEEEQPFMPPTFSIDRVGLLQANDTVMAKAVVNYIRGIDQAGMRSRQIDYDTDGNQETWRLGDIVNATPVVVQHPAENLDLLYGDETYQRFAAKYRNRRQMVYIGANDGMLHAFNAGWYDAAERTFLKGDPDSGATRYDLGAELWAYVPYNLLPHLRYITYPDYGSQDGDHLFFVDMQPVVFDARIFGPGGVAGQVNVDHTAGWGTLLVGGMRFGGREITVEANPGSPGSDVRTLRSALFVIDITDPENPPKLLLEFTHPGLGYTTGRPTPLKVGKDWYLMLGSGPFPADSETLAHVGSTQNGKLFLIDLNRMALEESFGDHGVLTISKPNSFVSDLVAVDYDLRGAPYTTDAVYFGTVTGESGARWSGNLQRVVLCANGGQNPALPVSQWDAKVLLETKAPITGAPSVGLDDAGNRWVYAGSGRYFTPADSADSSRQIIYGIKEPFDPVGGQKKQFTWGAVAWDDLEDVTQVDLYAENEDSRNEFETLKAQISANSAGWRLELTETGERSLVQAALLGDMLSFSTYVPSAGMCAVEGHSNFYSVYYTSGSAYFKPVIGTKIDGTFENGQARSKVLRKKSLGNGIAGTPELYRAKGQGIRAYSQASTGSLTVLEVFLPGVTQSGPIYWDLWAP